MTKNAIQKLITETITQGNYEEEGTDKKFHVVPLLTAAISPNFIVLSKEDEEKYKLPIGSYKFVVWIRKSNDDYYMMIDDGGTPYIKLTIQNFLDRFSDKE